MFSSSSFENDPPFVSKEIVMSVYTHPCVYTYVDLNLDLLLDLVSYPKNMYARRYAELVSELAYEY